MKKEDEGKGSAAPSGMSFEDATAALKDQEDAERAAARGAMLEEVSIHQGNYFIHII